MKKINYILFTLLAVVVFATSCGSDDDDTQSSAKAILEFKVGDVNGVINEEAKTITLQFADDPVLTNLVPTIKISNKAIITPASGISVDLTKPVVYTVKAEDGSTQSYTVLAKTGIIIPLYSPEIREINNNAQYTQGLNNIVITGTNLTDETQKGIVHFKLAGASQPYMTVDASSLNNRTTIFIQRSMLDDIKLGKQVLYVIAGDLKSNEVALEVLANTNPVPTITSISPESPASGELVTIIGTNYYGTFVDTFVRVLTLNADGKYMLFKEVNVNKGGNNGIFSTTSFDMPEVKGKFKLQVRSKGQLSNITEEYRMK